MEDRALAAVNSGTSTWSPPRASHSCCSRYASSTVGWGRKYATAAVSPVRLISLVEAEPEASRPEAPPPAATRRTSRTYSSNEGSYSSPSRALRMRQWIMNSVVRRPNSGLPELKKASR